MLIAGGAQVVPSRELVRRLRDAGLRLTPERRQSPGSSPTRWLTQLITRARDVGADHEPLEQLDAGLFGDVAHLQPAVDVGRRMVASSLSSGRTLATTMLPTRPPWAALRVKHSTTSSTSSGWCVPDTTATAMPAALVVEQQRRSSRPERLWIAIASMSRAVSAQLIAVDAGARQAVVDGGRAHGFPSVGGRLVQGKSVVRSVGRGCHTVRRGAVRWPHGAAEPA